jgi:hypothetical protein
MFAGRIGAIRIVMMRMDSALSSHSTGSARRIRLVVVVLCTVQRSGRSARSPRWWRSGCIHDYCCHSQRVPAGWGEVRQDVVRIECNGQGRFQNNCQADQRTIAVAIYATTVRSDSDVWVIIILGGKRVERSEVKGCRDGVMLFCWRGG